MAGLPGRQGAAAAESGGTAAQRRARIAGMWVLPYPGYPGGISDLHGRGWLVAAEGLQRHPLDPTPGQHERRQDHEDDCHGGPNDCCRYDHEAILVVVCGLAHGYPSPNMAAQPRIAAEPASCTKYAGKLDGCAGLSLKGIT